MTVALVWSGVGAGFHGREVVQCSSGQLARRSAGNGEGLEPGETFQAGQDEVGPWGVAGEVQQAPPAGDGQAGGDGDQAVAEALELSPAGRETICARGAAPVA